MEISAITELIATVGFPIVSCGALAVYVRIRDKQNTEDRKIERDLLLGEITFNREVNKELLATNKILAGDVKAELIDIKNEIKHLKE